MPKLEAINFQWWVDETVIVGDKDKKADKRMLDYFVDQDKVNKIMDMIEHRDFTTNELTNLLSEIKLDKLKIELNKYLEIVKVFEEKIIDYLIKKWLIDTSKDKQTVSIDFKWTNFDWIPAELLDLIWNFTLNKWSFKIEVEKVTDDNGNYTMKIDIDKIKKLYNIIDINIEKRA